MPCRFLFYSGLDVARANVRNRTLENGHLPIDQREFERAGILYSFTVFEPGMSPDPGGPLAGSGAGSEC